MLVSTHPSIKSSLCSGSHEKYPEWVSWNKTWVWMKKVVCRPVYQKPVYFLCIKERRVLLPSEQDSQPAAHTETQRPPAKPLASLYSTILSASQSQQGATGGEELCWIEEVDRLHGSGRSCLWLTEEPSCERLQPNWQADYDVESFWLSMLLQRLTARQVCLLVLMHSTQKIHRIFRKSFHLGLFVSLVW